MRVVWRRTAGETGGRSTVLEAFLEPTAHVSRLHAHPRQQQRVEVLAGSLGVQVGRRHAVVGPGARLVVAPGERHRFWNAGDETVQLVAETAPALRLESLLAALLAHERPGLLRLALVAAAHADTVRLSPAPPRLEGLALALAAPFGRVH